MLRIGRVSVAIHSCLLISTVISVIIKGRVSLKSEKSQHSNLKQELLVS
jgi:hypothetical protein